MESTVPITQAHLTYLHNIRYEIPIRFSKVYVGRDTLPLTQIDQEIDAIINLLYRAKRSFVYLRNVKPS